MPDCLPAKASPRPATLLWEASGPSPYLIPGTIRTKFNRSRDFAYLNFGQKIFLPNLPGPCYDPIPSPDCSARLTAGSSFQSLPSFLPLCSPELAHLCGSLTHLLTHTPSLPNPEALSSRKGCLFLYQITPAWLWQCGCERLCSPWAASRHFSPTLVKS